MFVLSVLATAAVSAFALTVYGIASFGEGMMYQILLQVCSRIDSSVCDGDISTSTLTLSLSAMLTNPIQLWILREHVDWKLGRNLALFQGIGVVIGVRILFLTSSLILPHILGLIMFFVMSQKVTTDVCLVARGASLEQEVLKKYELVSTKNYATVWLVGLASGLLSGMYGTAGPPLIIFFSTINLEKNIVRGTVSFCDNVINFCRISSFAINFMLQGHDSNSEYGQMSLGQLAIMYMAVTSGAMTGLGIGNTLTKYVNQFAFKYLVLLILGVGSVLLSSVGMSTADVVVVALALLTVFITWNVVAFLFVRQQSLRHLGASDSSIARIEYYRLPLGKYEEDSMELTALHPGQGVNLGDPTLDDEDDAEYGRI